MPQSILDDPIHLVFSTKNRAPLISLDIEAELHRYLAGILRTYQCPGILIGSAADHVHILFAMGRTISFADLVEEVKKGSSKWMKTKGPQYRQFYWQNGYGGFGVGEDTEAVKKYIAGQRAHHERVSFQDEYREFLRRHNIAFDERYVWD
jgi:REP element-mobilizing transposase RayT